MQSKLAGIFAIALALSIGLEGPLGAATNAGTCADPAELKIYQSRFADAGRSIASCRLDLARASNADSMVDAAYRKGYFDQELKFREIELEIHRWQINAANAILVLVGLLTVFGIAFSGYQLWRVNQISKAAPAGVEIEISLSKLRIQTSVIGAIVLFVSYAFLLVFTRDIYTIHRVSQPASEASQAKPVDKPTTAK